MELLSNLGGSVWACWTFVLTLVTVPLAAASDSEVHLQLTCLRRSDTNG